MGFVIQRVLLTLCAVLAGALQGSEVSAQSVGTGFTYQGELRDATAPANGNYDVEFQLFTAATGGSQVGPTNVFSTTNGNPVAVNGGVFSVRLDFGDQFSGERRFLLIRVKRPQDATFTVLAPRQEISPAPHALNAEFITDGRVDGGSIVDGAVAAADIDITQVQRRVVGSCPGNSAVRGINADGSVDCTASPTTAFQAGSAGAIATSLSSIGPPVVVSVAAGQRIHVTAHAALGSSATGGATSLNLFICQRPVGGALTAVGFGMFGLTVPQNQRHTYGLSAAVIGLAAGSYEVGLCGSSAQAAAWNNNEWAYASAIVL